MLEMNSVSTSYGSVPMLRDVSLQVGPGEMVCLLGPNGAGKSTTFNAICGLLRSDSGSIRIAGRDVKECGTERLASLGAGFVPEGRRLFPTLTVRENLRLAFDAARNPALDFEAQLERMADLFPRIRERLGQKAGTMSGGEQAMVALARALIGDPRLVVMDEPSLGLSPKLIDEYFQIVSRIRDEGKAVLLIEQNAETALSIAERGYLLIRGKIALSGKSSDLLQDDTIRHLYL
ncbi:ABC transporter ATP-binding protein [Aquamicrobium sp. NLF2-7]|uniref:ABC transporter ATP-binding protein n=1 Tax=Aquamicrobium sp. NLF2-7 TaxID=2918753 RepID=UPI001EFBE20D|nr:ABC transporter ATP-binding protein [Aquamicrobium sp. NLF2-7]MCG8271189.1 ABC transporter ATP-binding protein [Aquamicrobium sp. NLF2-7]